MLQQLYTYNYYIYIHRRSRFIQNHRWIFPISRPDGQEENSHGKFDTWLKAGIEHELELGNGGTHLLQLSPVYYPFNHWSAEWYPKSKGMGWISQIVNFRPWCFGGLPATGMFQSSQNVRLRHWHNKLLQRQPPNTLGMCLEGGFHSDFHNLRSILQSCLAVSSPNPESRYSVFFLCILVTSWLRLDWEDLVE